MEVTLVGDPSSFIVKSKDEVRRLVRNGLLAGVTLCEDSLKRSPDAARMMSKHGVPFCYIAGGINELSRQQNKNLLSILSALPAIYLLSPERAKHPLVQLLRQEANLHDDIAFWSLFASYEVKM